MKKYHDYVSDLTGEEVQPFMVVEQGDFISVRQWDGTNEFVHWVIIPKVQGEQFIQQVRELLK